MKVNKTFDRREIETIVRKHFESVEGVKLNNFSFEIKGDEYNISYNTELVQPTATEKLTGAVTNLFSGVRSMIKP